MAFYTIQYTDCQYHLDRLDFGQHLPSGQTLVDNLRRRLPELLHCLSNNKPYVPGDAEQAKQQALEALEEACEFEDCSDGVTSRATFCLPTLAMTISLYARICLASVIDGDVRPSNCDLVQL